MHSEDQRLDLSEILEPVKDICESLPPSISRSSAGPLIFILDENQQLREYDPPAKAQSCLGIVRNYISLEDLLCQTKLRPFQSLYLAVSFASSLLQLHSTPWLPWTWSENSIYFPVHGFDVKQPYVLIKFETPHNPPVSESEHKTLNPYLVALGIILLELSEGKSFAKWISEKQIHIEPDDVQDKASVAWKWVDEDAKLRNVGPVYGKIIKRYLECSFTSVQPQNYKNLDYEPFREAVSSDIVHPLEMIYDAVTNPLKHDVYNFTG
jgi:hypothetical protein